MLTRGSLLGHSFCQLQPQPVLPDRQSRLQLAGESRDRRYVVLSGAVAVALALLVLFATSHRMINLYERGKFRSLLALSKVSIDEPGSHKGTTINVLLSTC